MALTLTERPQTFDEVKGHEEVVENLRKQVKVGKISHFYTLEGNRGSGKTTIGRILAKAINCSNPDDRGNPCCECPACTQIQNGNSPDYIELDAASNNGVDSVRALIDSTNYVPMNLKYKVILIDEAHMLSTGAFNAFLKTLEEPPEYCIFIMATTDINKIPITVQSRAMIYQFKRISVDVIQDHVINVAQKYNVTIEPDAAAIIAKKATGAMRDALSDLEKCLLVGETITVQDVMDVCGIADMERLLSLVGDLCDYERVGAFCQIEELYAKGRDLKYCVSECLSILTDIIRYKNSGDAKILCQAETYNEKVIEIAERTGNARLSSVADGLMQLRAELSRDPSKNSVLVHISKMCEKALDVSLLFEKIRQLEAVVSGNGKLPVESRTAENRTQEQPAKVTPSEQSKQKVQIQKPNAPQKDPEKDEKTTENANQDKKGAENRSQAPVKPAAEVKKTDEPKKTAAKIENTGNSKSSKVVSSGNGMFHYNGSKKKNEPEKAVETPKETKSEKVPKTPTATNHEKKIAETSKQKESADPVMAGTDFFGSLMGVAADGFTKVSAEDVPFGDEKVVKNTDTSVKMDATETDKLEPEDVKSPLDELLENEAIRHAVENFCTVSSMKNGQILISCDHAPIIYLVDAYIRLSGLEGGIRTIQFM